MAVRCPGLGCYNDATLDGHVCEACWAYRHLMHREVAWLRPAVHELLVPGNQRSQYVSGGAGPSSKEPLRMAALEAMEKSLVVAVRWAAYVRDRRKFSPMPRIGTVREDWLFPLALNTLIRLDPCLADTWPGDDYYNELLRVFMALRVLQGDSIGESEHIDGTCPNCHSMSLCARGYRHYVVCLTCGARWGQAAWYSLNDADA
jgi:hypothetical protein